MEDKTKMNGTAGCPKVCEVDLANQRTWPVWETVTFACVRTASSFYRAPFILPAHVRLATTVSTRMAVGLRQGLAPMGSESVLGRVNF